MTDLTGPDDSPTQPNLYGLPGPPPAGFWDELKPVPPPAAQPGWSAPGWSSASPEPAAYPPDPDGVPGIVIASSRPDRDARRRGALMAVAGVVLATVVVVLATVVIGPRLGSDDGKTDNVAPPVSPTGSPTPTSDPTSSAASANTQSPASAASSAVASVGSSASAAKPGPTAGSATTTTTRAATTGTTKIGPLAVTTTVGSGGSGTGHPTTSSSTRQQPSVVFSTIEPSTPAQHHPGPPATSTSAPGPVDLGVPTREIPCSTGLIVQLASELSPQAFRARVQALQSQGLVPGDAAAATSGGSCGIFANQTNTYILYSGPFGDLGDACNDRLAGPYDAYIKGGNPGTAGSFFSCICPARAHRLPTIASVGQTGQWVGELQRMLGAHLRYGVGGLDDSSWGHYTNGTKAAVQRFQSDHHLKPNGVVDDKTWGAIQSAGC